MQISFLLTLTKPLTHYFIQQEKKIHLDSLSICDRAIDRVNSCKFLGVTIELGVTFIVERAVSKVSKSVGIISNIRCFIDKQTKKSVLILDYYLLFPCVNYCNVVWTANYPNYNFIFTPTI